MRGFLIALQFLTILPIKIKNQVKGEDLGRSLFYFPLVGLLIGLLLGASAIFLSFLPDLIRGTLLVVFSVIVTGGLHLDGFADTCDGLYGQRPKEKILEIMQDSRIGAMGVMGIVCILLVKFSILSSLSTDYLPGALIAMFVFSRWFQLVVCTTSFYARSTGKARFFIEHAQKRDAILGGIFTLSLFTFLVHLRGILIFLIALLPLFLFTKFIKNKIGGMTGDTIGAVNEVAEVVVLFLFLLYQGV